MKRLVLMTLVLLGGFGASVCATEKGEPNVPRIRGDVTPIEAHEMLIADPEHIFLIDCRTMAEYELVGHPTMAYNIPYKLWTPKGMRIKTNFAKDVAEKFKKTDRLLIICRSGKRSCLACKALSKAGFKHIFNVLDGFEGDRVRDKRSANYGHRRYINGWQHDGLPYTYQLNKKLTYKLYSSCGCE